MGTLFVTCAKTQLGMLFVYCTIWYSYKAYNMRCADQIDYIPHCYIIEDVNS